jgi:hypothetical protein
VSRRPVGGPCYLPRVGLRSALRLVDAAATYDSHLAAASPRTGAQVGIRSPFNTGALSTVAWNDLLTDSAYLPVTRGQAMTVPAVARAVQLVTAAAASCPLLQLDADAPTDPQPRWAYATDAAMPPQLRTQLLVDDLMMEGWALLAVDRDSAGTVTAVSRVAPESWTFTGDGQVEVEGAPAQEARYALVKGPTDGFLWTAASTIRGALDLERAWRRAIRNPTPVTILHQTTDDELTDDEIAGLLTDWKQARQDDDGAVAYLPASVSVETPGAMVPDLLVEARNAVSVDVARHLGVPATALDAGPVQSSLTYANAQTQGGLAVIVQGVRPYLNALAWRLSQDDLTPPGTRMAYDTTDLDAAFDAMSRTGPPTAD